MWTAVCGIPVNLAKCKTFPVDVRLLKWRRPWAGEVTLPLEHFTLTSVTRVKDITCTHIWQAGRLTGGLYVDR